MTKLTKQQTKNHLFPPRQIYFNDEDKSYHLELDGFNCFLQLTKTGADVIELACANTPVHKTWGYFWGYKNYPKDDRLFGPTLPQKNSDIIHLASPDKKALLAVADVLSNKECWKQESQIKDHPKTQKYRTFNPIPITQEILKENLWDQLAAIESRYKDQISKLGIDNVDHKKWNKRFEFVSNKLDKLSDQTE